MAGMILLDFRVHRAGVAPRMFSNSLNWRGVKARLSSGQFANHDDQQDHQHLSKLGTNKHTLTVG
jgi:hypothetical protein